MKRPPVIALFPEASFGAALNCVGIARELAARGAEPVFLCHPGFTGVFAEYGFREYHLQPEAGPAQARGEAYWQNFVNTHLAHFDLTPAAQLDAYVAPTWEAIIDTVIAVDDSLEALLGQIQPDAILLDNVIMFPAILRSGRPWARVVSCAETEIPDALVPPYLSGLGPDDTVGRALWEKAATAALRPAHHRYNAFRRARGLRALPPGQFLECSDWLNLLLAPSAVRYPRAEALPADRFTFLEGCVRDEVPFDPPALPANDGPLVYMSFGSLGAIDTDQIRRMIAVFATIPARFFVNVGGFLDDYREVPDNVFLGSWFPQPSVVAQSALFIHHGGNNSFCEALFHGVPSLVMAYCWDGHDNARRAQDTGTGRSMHRSDWSPETLRGMIEALLNDHALRGRLAAISAQMKADPGVVRAADAVLSRLGAG
ncbi:glycosyltransferase [Ancylobacter amanitiformis]|uniref:MGT family glycosyltransferase n=1 Tax=Ancylobacter amanitiformis TaxID=217069 RepID=A0ABU0LKC6_9HYPH|nr:glycosyltransferase [Ancylobacter amanitiformis]MDQ0509155.1 MGT family glycosyltransferase [Ancylobacter amanitiformis]